MAVYASNISEPTPESAYVGVYVLLKDGIKNGESYTVKVEDYILSIEKNGE